MIVRLTPRLSRIAALTLAAVVVALVGWLVIVPLVSRGHEQSDQLALLRKQAQIMQGMIDAAPQYEAVMKRLAANPDIQSYVFATPQPSLAVAQLQSQVNQIVAKAGGNVTTSQALPESPLKALTKISVTTTFEGDMKAAVATLHAIETARPLLFVAKLTIRDPDGEWAAPVAQATPNKLLIEMLVTAYMRKT